MGKLHLIGCIVFGFTSGTAWAGPKILCHLAAKDAWAVTSAGSCSDSAGTNLGTGYPKSGQAPWMCSTIPTSPGMQIFYGLSWTEQRVRADCETRMKGSVDRNPF